MLVDLHIDSAYDGFLFLAESVRNPPVLKPHRHAELELNLVVSGEIRYVVEDRSYHFPAGTLLWLFPGQTHQLVDRTPNAQYYVAVFSPGLLAEICREDPYRVLRSELPPTPGVPRQTLGPEIFTRLRATMADLTVDGMDPDLLNREAGYGVNPGFRFAHHDPARLNAGLRHLVLDCWWRQSQHAPAAPRQVLHPAVRKALRILNERDPPPRLEELAQQSGLSPSSLSRVFARQMGISLTRHRNSILLSRFMGLRNRDPAATLLESVYAAGFGSYAQFHRIFRDAYGDSPRNALQGIEPRL